MDTPSFFEPLSDLQPQGFAVADDGPSKTLPLVMQGQDHPEWCWAANASSVSVFLGLGAGVSQCRIASICLDMDCCPPTPDEPPAWQGNTDWRIEPALTAAGNFAPPAQGRVGMGVVMSQIDAGLPICAHVHWDADQGHFVTICGYDASNRSSDVIVRDPLLPGDQHLPIESFASDYRSGGTWDASYLTRKADGLQE